MKAMYKVWYLLNNPYSKYADGADRKKIEIYVFAFNTTFAPICMPYKCITYWGEKETYGSV